MTRHKVTVVGGGMAGLMAAYELTRTPALQARYEVTVYQLGWRLGGKIASGRDAKGRNVEHGLHVLFGAYENVFGLIKELYGARVPPADCPLKTWQDVAKPQILTPIGVPTPTGWRYFPLKWPNNGGSPGDGSGVMTPLEAWQTLVSLIRRALEGVAGSIGIPSPRARGPVPEWCAVSSAIPTLLRSTSRSLADLA